MGLHSCRALSPLAREFVVLSTCPCHDKLTKATEFEVIASCKNSIPNSASLASILVSFLKLTLNLLPTPVAELPHPSSKIDTPAIHLRISVFENATSTTQTKDSDQKYNINFGKSTVTVDQSTTTTKHKITRKIHAKRLLISSLYTSSHQEHDIRNYPSSPKFSHVLWRAQMGKHHVDTLCRYSVLAGQVLDEKRS